MAQRSAVTADNRQLAERFQQARLNVGTLLGNAAVRAETRAAAVATILEELERRRDLSPEQHQATAERMADARLQELQRMADTRGYISGANAERVFRWLDSFDRNGTSRSINLFSAPDATSEAQLTHAGRVYKRILESTEADTRFGEEDFVAGFMNGSFDPQRFRNLTTAQVEVLQRAGIYEQLRARLERSQLPQELSPDALSRMFRRLDNTIDRDGNGATMTARGPTAAAQRETPFPLDVRRPDQQEENDTYRTVRILRDLFAARDAGGPSPEESRPRYTYPAAKPGAHGESPGARPQPALGRARYHRARRLRQLSPRRAPQPLRGRAHWSASLAPAHRGVHSGGRRHRNSCGAWRATTTAPASRTPISSSAMTPTATLPVPPGNA